MPRKRNNRNSKRPAAAQASASPSSLRGITSTNDDPSACALCSALFPMGMSNRNSFTSHCCGKRICVVCFDSPPATKVRCAFCKAPFILSAKDEIGSLKKHAKKGKAWAQYLLGVHHGSGEIVAQSDYEAKRWCEKAAKQGPDATYCLGVYYQRGCAGCSINLSKARELFEKAMVLDSNLVDECRWRLVGIAIAYNKLNTTDGANEAKSILMPLADDGVAMAQYTLGASFMMVKDFSNAKRWFAAAALQGIKNAATDALVCCEDPADMPEANFWFKIISEPGMMPENLKARIILGGIYRNLRQLRDHCGGCGTALEGERRHYCRQCRTYCYCNRECQKLHWNRAGGHRRECMEVQSLKEKWEEAHCSSASCSGK